MLVYSHISSLHLGHTEVKATYSGRFNWSTRRLQAVTGDHAAPATLDVAGQMDEAATADDWHLLHKWMMQTQITTLQNSRNAIFVAAGVLKLTIRWRRSGD